MDWSVLHAGMRVCPKLQCVSQCCSADDSGPRAEDPRTISVGCDIIPHP